MSNERIDLTQFEDLTTPWDFGKKYPHIESAKVAVELIAELKKCYVEIDELKSKIEDIALAVENNNIDYLMNCL